MSSTLDRGARAGAGGMAPDLAVRIGPLALATPVLLASGTCKSVRVAASPAPGATVIRGGHA